MSPSELAVLAKSVRDYDRLVALKPTRVKNDIASDVNLRKGNLQLNLSRFKTRMRTSDSQVIEVKINNGGKTSKVFGRVTEVKGKSAQVSLKSGVVQGGRISVSTLGKDDPTNSEMERTDVVLTCLQKANSLFTESFTTWIFLGRRFPTSPSTTRPSVCFPGTRQLNDSQDPRREAYPVKRQLRSCVSCPGSPWYWKDNRDRS
ncbi:hypothetical protein QCA50_006016 [Cerrena zonata]|uniref:Uncharacterized protein n=1 Tax=Cerrena zonata TaxID=2478898 RepID=A0AAW0GBU8_9APHY